MALGLSSAAGASHAVVVVLGGMGQSCWQASKEADRSRTVPEGAVDLCTRALESALGEHDMAGTYVNRGVLYMIDGDLASAMADFSRAVQVSPKLAEAHVNLGAAMVGMRLDKDGISEIDQGLAMGSAEPEKSYFNRAVAEEHLDDLSGAYQDYMKAAELKPSWQQPKQELTRFTVEPASTATQR
jgi:tetratricopeptide (TPR) repeat protein